MHSLKKKAAYLQLDEVIDAAQSVICDCVPRHVEPDKPAAHQA
jgi:hypothetical protein